MVIASGGYDLPSFEKLTTFKIWAEEGPPKGTLYHYPNPYNHQILSVAGGARAAQDRRADLHPGASQTQMAVRYFKGEPMEKTLDWAAKRDRRLHAQLGAPRIGGARPSGGAPPDA